MIVIVLNAFYLCVVDFSNIKSMFLRLQDEPFKRFVGFLFIECKALSVKPSNQGSSHLSPKQYHDVPMTHSRIGKTRLTVPSMQWSLCLRMHMPKIPQNGKR